MPDEIVTADDPDASDESLLQRLAAGELAAFDMLYARHELSVWRYAIRIVRAPAVADDLLQDVWIAVLQQAADQDAGPAAANGFEAPGAAGLAQGGFRTRLFAMAHQRVIERVRTAKNHPGLRGARPKDGTEAGVPETPAPYPAFGPIPPLRSRQQALALLTAVEQLPFAHRYAFLMQAEGGVGAADIASVTGVSVETARSRLRHADLALRLSLKTDLAPEERHPLGLDLIVHSAADGDGAQDALIATYHEAQTQDARRPSARVRATVRAQAKALTRAEDSFQPTQPFAPAHTAIDRSPWKAALLAGVLLAAVAGGLFLQLDRATPDSSEQTAGRADASRTASKQTAALPPSTPRLATPPVAPVTPDVAPPAIRPATTPVAPPVTASPPAPIAPKPVEPAAVAPPPVARAPTAPPLVVPQPVAPPQPAPVVPAKVESAPSASPAMARAPAAPNQAVPEPATPPQPAPTAPAKVAPAPVAPSVVARAPVAPTPALPEPATPPPQAAPAKVAPEPVAPPRAVTEAALPRPAAPAPLPPPGASDTERLASVAPARPRPEPPVASSAIARPDRVPAAATDRSPDSAVARVEPRAQARARPASAAERAALPRAAVSPARTPSLPATAAARVPEKSASPATVVRTPVPMRGIVVATPSPTAQRRAETRVASQAPARRAAEAPAGDATRALLRAARNGRTADMERALARGASINAPDAAGRTPLILAAANGHTAAVRRLIAAGVNPALIDRTGADALDYARRSKVTATVQVIEAAR